MWPPPWNLSRERDWVKIGVAADLFQVVVWVFLALTLDVLLRHVSGDAAGAMAAWSRSGRRSSSSDILFEFQGMRVVINLMYTVTVGTGDRRPWQCGCRPAALR